MKVWRKWGRFVIQPKYQNHLVVSLSVLAVGVTMAMVQYKVPTIMIAIMEQYAMSASGGSCPSSRS